MQEALATLAVFDAWTLTILVVSSFAAGVVHMVAGFGGALLLLALYSFFLPPERLIPVVALIMVLTHTIRLFLWRKEANWLLVLFFFIGALPGASFGSYLFSILPAAVLKKLLGSFLLLFATLNLINPNLKIPVKKGHFVPLGAFVAFASAIVGGAGPITVPFLISFGLSGAALSATAMGTQFCSHIVKVVNYIALGVFSVGDMVLSVMLALIVVPSIFVGKWMVEHMSPKLGRVIVLTLLMAVGLRFLLT